jgi:glutathione S-transferase
MHLISLPVSPFAARVRIAIYAKKLKIEIAPPPTGWPTDRKFRDVNPTGRIPVLVLGDGRVIQESAVIVEFLEERFPETRRLLPSDLYEKAKARLLVRVADLYLMPPMASLARPRTDQRQTAGLAEELMESFTTLDKLLDGQTYAVGNQLSLADCALAPVFFAAKITGGRLGTDLIEAAPRVAQYADFLRHDEHVARVLAEMDHGLRQLTQGD